MSSTPQSTLELEINAAITKPSEGKTPIPPKPAYVLQ